MRTLAILPVKSFGQAKQRLSEEVAPGTRETLARAMLDDVLGTLARVPELDAIVVVSANPLAERLAGRPGIEVLHDPREDGQSAAALIGIAHAHEHDFDRVLLVPGDAPLLDAAELTTLLTTPTPPVVIVPDRHGSGTNGLLLTPPAAIEPGFGPGSRKRHEARATAADLAFEVQPLSSLVVDVDTPDDLRTVAAALDAHPGGAPATRAALAAIAVAGGAGPR